MRAIDRVIDEIHYRREQADVADEYLDIRLLGRVPSRF